MLLYCELKIFILLLSTFNMHEEIVILEVTYNENVKLIILLN